MYLKEWFAYTTFSTTCSSMSLKIISNWTRCHQGINYSPNHGVNSNITFSFVHCVLVDVINPVSIVYIWFLWSNRYSALSFFFSHLPFLPDQIQEGGQSSTTNFFLQVVVTRKALFKIKKLSHIIETFRLGQICGLVSILQMLLYVEPINSLMSSC